MPSVFSVTTYWCSTALTARCAPASLAVSAPHMPVALTATSHSIRPCSVWTAVTRRPARSIPVTRQFWATRTPAARAPVMNERVSWLGSTYPSDGVQVAPYMPSVFSSGKISPASAGETRWMSKP